MRLMRTPYSVKELWRKYYSTCLNKVQALFSGGKYFVQNQVWTTVHTHLLAKIMPFYSQALANISKNSCRIYLKPRFDHYISKKQKKKTAVNLHLQCNVLWLSTALFKRTAILNEEEEFLKDCPYVLNQH